MSAVVRIDELQVGDQIQWPDGKGGFMRPTVLRALETGHGDDYEILLGGCAADFEECGAAQGKLLMAVTKTYSAPREVNVRKRA